MTIDELSEHAYAHLKVLAPKIEDPAFLVDACITNARKYFRDEFITELSPDAWARLTLLYHKHFLDSGQDISIAEIISEVVRDSINTKRMDMVTLNLTQKKIQESQNTGGPSLKIVKD